MRWRVSSLIGMVEDVSFKTRDTVLCETPAKRATSCIVGILDALSIFFLPISLIVSTAFGSQPIRKPLWLGKGNNPLV